MSAGATAFFSIDEVMFDGEVTPDWQHSEPIFVGGVGVVDMFFQLSAPPGGMMLALPMSFDWHLQLNPSGDADDWYSESVELVEADGTMNYKPAMRHLSIETLLLEVGDLKAQTQSDAMIESRQHARIGLNARQMRVVFRGQLGSPGGQVSIVALRGR